MVFDIHKGVPGTNTLSRPTENYTDNENKKHDEVSGKLWPGSSECLCSLAFQTLCLSLLSFSKKHLFRALSGSQQN